MKKGLALLLLGLCCLAPLACRNKPITLPPVSITPTFTSTPTIISTPGCGYTLVTVPTPVTPPVPVFYGDLQVGNPVPGTNFVIRNLSDWQNYCAPASVPAPPVNFASQMILINVQAVYVPSYPPYGTEPVSVCWTNTEVTVSCLLQTSEQGPIVPIYLTPVITPTPTPPVPEYIVTSLAVPISSLPVTWIYTEELIAL